MRVERLDARWGLIQTVVGIVLALALAAPASASAAGVYVALGDSVGAGFGASPGQSYFDRYCAYLKATAAVDQCVNESAGGLTTQTALDSGAVQNVVNGINQPTDTKVVTVELGGNDVLGPGCQPVTGASCKFASNMAMILDQIKAALAHDPGGGVIQTVEYYNPDLGNPFGKPSMESQVASLLLGSDGKVSDCSTTDTSPIGLNDQINCISILEGASPVDLYVPFANDCNNDCFSDSLHPNDRGYGVIFAALRDNLTASMPVAPQNTNVPVVSGAPMPGSNLTCAPGTWSGSAPLTLTIQWLRDGSVMPGQTDPTYLVAPTDVGHTISCLVAARNAAGTASATSAAILIGSSPVVQTKATITGLTENKRRFTPRRHGRGVVFSFRLDQPAQVTIVIARRKHRPRIITTLNRAAHEGLNRVKFSGRIHGKALKPGRYEAIFTATDSAGAAASQVLRFRIIRR